MEDPRSRQEQDEHGDAMGIDLFSVCRVIKGFCYEADACMRNYTYACIGFSFAKMVTW